MDADTDRRAEAIERLQEKRDFRRHLQLYIVINALLIIVWAATGAAYFWPIWVLGGWGVGVALHAFGIWGQKPITEDDIRAETRRLKNS